MSMNLRVVVVGAGRMGADHIQRLTRWIRGAEVAAVVTWTLRARQRAAQAAPPSVAVSDVRRALDRADVDAELVATPGASHEATLLQVLERGLPVLCEKPLTPEAASSWKIVEAEQRSGRKRIQVGFMRRFDAEYRRLVASGEPGQLLMHHYVHRNPAPPPGFTAAMLITDSVVHEFDAIRYLTGEEIRTVQVRVGRTSRHAEAEQQREPQHVLIETESGVLADVDMFVNAQFGYQVTYQAAFEKAVLDIGQDTGPRVFSAGRRGGARSLRVSSSDSGPRTMPSCRAGSMPLGAVKSAAPRLWTGMRAACCCEAGVAALRTGERVAVSLRSKPDSYR